MVHTDTACWRTVGNVPKSAANFCSDFQSIGCIDWEYVPYSEDARYIIVIRDPRTCLYPAGSFSLKMDFFILSFDRSMICSEFS